MNPHIKNDIQQRGEELGAFIRSGCKTEGVGTGISAIAQLIEFGGEIPKGTGQDKSNLTSIISMQKYLRTGEPRILETLEAWTVCYEANPKPAAAWLFHHLTGESQQSNSKRLRVGITKYKIWLQVAEMGMAARLG